LVVGGVGPEVEVHSIKEGKLLTRFKAHAKSVRVASVVTVDKLPLLVTAANDRFIRLWQVPVSMPSYFQVGSEINHALF